MTIPAQTSLSAVIHSPAAPARERITHQLTLLLIDADELLDIVTEDGGAHTLRWLEPNVREVYDSVSALLTLLST